MTETATSSGSQLKEELHGHPRWSEMSAKERTLLYCETAERLGLPIPAWTEIRRITERGSASTINDAKQHFLEENRKLLLRIKSGHPEIPAPIVRSVQEVWMQAIEEARNQFSSKEAEIESRLNQANAERERMHHIATDAEQQANQLKAHNEGLEEALSSLKSQLERETYAREKAEKTVIDVSASYEGQKESLQNELDYSRTELKKALDRLEGMERFKLRQIEEARTEANRKIANIEAKYKPQVESLRLEEQKLRARIKQFSDAHEKSQSKCEALEARNSHLVEQNNHLNSHVSALLKQTGAQDARLQTLEIALKKCQKRLAAKRR